MSCPNQRTRDLALDPLEQLRREIDSDSGELPDIDLKVSRADLDVLERVWNQDLDETLPRALSKASSRAASRRGGNQA